MRPSRINPAISAYTQVHGVLDFNQTPMGPPGCKVQVHVRPEQRASWDEKAVDGFYVGPSMHHYRNYHCYIPSTRGTRDSDTITWLPHNFDVPTTSSTD